MQQRPRDEGRHRSPFAAAFLSLLFPGLGQAYVGFYGRALAFAAPLILIIALGGGLVINAQTRLASLAALSSPSTLLAILVLNAILLAYRVVAIVDAFRLAQAANALSASGASDRLGRPRVRWHPVAIAGLLAVILVASIAHGGRPLRSHRHDLVTSIGQGGDDEDPRGDRRWPRGRSPRLASTDPTDDASAGPTDPWSRLAAPTTASWDGRSASTHPPRRL
jgi:hypothetical protein